MDENTILIALGIVCVFILGGMITKKIIFFDSEEDLWTNIFFFFWGACFVGVFSLYPDLVNYTVVQKIFFWLGLIVFGLVALGCLVKTYTVGIKGNGIILGTFMFLKITFTLVMIMFVLGKLSEMSDDKKKKKEILLHFLALLVVLKVFWKPLKISLSMVIESERVEVSLSRLMKHKYFLFFVLLTLIASCGGGSSSGSDSLDIPPVPPQTYPSHPLIWDTATPESVGMNASSLVLQ